MYRPGKTTFFAPDDLTDGLMWSHCLQKFVMDGPQRETDPETLRGIRESGGSHTVPRSGTGLQDLENSRSLTEGVP